MQNGNFEEKGMAHCKVCRELCIRILRSREPRIRQGSTLAPTGDHLRAVTMLPYVKLLSSLLYLCPVLEFLNGGPYLQKENFRG